MTSGRFHSYPLADIGVDRENRQRRQLNNIDDLAESISRIGLINPIVLTPDGVLVAGERRLTACTQLGWTAIPAQFTDELTDYELQSIELEENIKRENITWQEEVAALARFHELKRAHEPDWKTEDTAAALGISARDTTRKIALNKHMGNGVIAGAATISSAINIMERNVQRKKASALAGVGEVLAQTVPTIEAAPAAPLLNTSFHEWQATYDGPRFNLIHCDFPYGVNVADTARMGATMEDRYEDTPDIYWSLLARLSAAMDNVVADSAHLIFWHSMKFHIPTVDALTRMGWKCNPFPLIWHKSDGAGIAPDPQRGPRQTYEAAIFAVRGDRRITQAGCVANSFAYPGRRGEAIHVSEKPYAMLRHFMRMVCDEYSRVFDPTCGSGSALKVAEDLGASEVLGLEQSPEFYETAIANWSRRGEN